MNEQIDKIKEKLMSKTMHPNADFLVMSRVPKDVSDAFKRYANEQFCGDYGMAFRNVWDEFYTKPAQIGQIYDLLQNHEDRMLVLEGKKDLPKKIIKTLSGREITIGG
jgi:hypothetical protein